MDWDKWRVDYPAMSYQDQQVFHSQVWDAYPVQRHYDPGYVAAAIGEVEPLTVVELGGWDGELAATMLDKFPSIILWSNVEVCREAAAAGEGRHPRYNVAGNADWYWSRRWTADLLVASHVIEHLSAADLDRVVGVTDARALFFDAPLVDEPTSWAGFTGSHVLEVGWDGVTDICRGHGYRLVWGVDHETDVSSGGAARACLYCRP